MGLLAVTIFGNKLSGTFALGVVVVGVVVVAFAWSLITRTRR